MNERLLIKKGSMNPKESESASSPPLLGRTAGDANAVRVFLVFKPPKKTNMRRTEEVEVEALES